MTECDEIEQAQMANILPKNPYVAWNIETRNYFNEATKHNAWQQCQDDTMKVLRPILERSLSYITGSISYLGYKKQDSELVTQLEQILKEV